jgi:hypothetical protein
MTGDTEVASAAPPAIRLEFLKKVRREIASGRALPGLTAVSLATALDVLVSFFMIYPPRLNVGRLVIVEDVLG